MSKLATTIWAATYAAAAVVGMEVGTRLAPPEPLNRADVVRFSVRNSIIMVYLHKATQNVRGCSELLGATLNACRDVCGKCQ